MNWTGRGLTCTIQASVSRDGRRPLRISFKTADLWAEFCAQVDYEAVVHSFDGAVRCLHITAIILITHSIILRRSIDWMPITVAVLSNAWTAFARSSTGVMGSNPTRSMDVCMRLFCVCVVLCVGSGLTMGWSPVREVLPTLHRLRNWKSG
jgi:hypothetical protein